MNDQDQCECNHFRNVHVHGGKGECVHCTRCTAFKLATAADHVYCTEEMLDQIVSVSTAQVIYWKCRHCEREYRSLEQLENENWRRRKNLENDIAMARVRLPEILKDLGGLAER